MVIKLYKEHKFNHEIHNQTDKKSFYDTELELIVVFFKFYYT